MRFDSHHSEHDQQPASQANADTDSLPSKFELSELERSLPDDLQHLAEQLSDDALHLSAIYPRHAPQQWLVSAQQPADSLEDVSSVSPWAKLRKLRFITMKPAMAAAGLLLAVTLAWQAIPTTPQPASMPIAPTQADLKPSPAPAVLDATEALADETALALYPVINHPAESSRVIGTVQTEQTMVPAGLFLTLSGPEQEAMLDLIEDAKLQQPSVSF